MKGVCVLRPFRRTNGVRRKGFEPSSLVLGWVIQTPIGVFKRDFHFTTGINRGSGWLLVVLNHTTIEDTALDGLNLRLPGRAS